MSNQDQTKIKMISGSFYI